MGFTKFFNLGENKGLDCDFETKEGIVVGNCKRTKQQKDGTQVSDGQNFNVYADPSNDCEPAITGHYNVLDNDSEVIKQVREMTKKGCKRGSKKGLLPQKAQ